ncbi:RNA-binding motif [Durusdinium trenchii]
METVDDAKWIVEHVNGNVPQNLTDPVTVVFATPRADRAKGKGMKLGGRVHAASGGETQW